MSLFGAEPEMRAQETAAALQPLAERMRPRTLDEVMGQEKLLGPGKPLRVQIENDNLTSMLLWGPPGCGKTTLARLIARLTKSEFVSFSAVLSGIKEIKEVMADAEKKSRGGRRTIVFVDEVHRFNKAQQDALLHSVEDGLITLIGATTENPSFEVISPLLSRTRLYVLQPLTDAHLNSILDRALKTDALLATQDIVVQNRDYLLMLSGGDARMMLNGLETAVSLARPDHAGRKVVGRKEIEEAFQRKYVKYDKGGEEHYNTISAFIKSVRGSDPDAAVYWLARMLEGGEDPKFIARRMIVLASEDIGNAAPDALTLATSCFTAVDYIGMPEARLVLAQCATYLASCPKSNASYIAIGEAMQDINTSPDDPVPMHLRNAPTKLMEHLGYGEDYKYSHEYNSNFVEQQYLPQNLKERIYYRPSDNGEERSIRARLNAWWKSRQR